MPESDATDKEQRPPLLEELWQDKILGDALGYTKGLVTVLDSLSEGFRRRGRELEEQRQRLVILQSERRAILEERVGLEAQLGSLAAERDGLRSKSEDRDRELDGLRQGLSQHQATLEARTREIQELRVGMTESTQQVEELRGILRELEQEKESNAERQAARAAEIEGEQLRMREASVWASQELIALRENLTNAGAQLEMAHRDLAGAQDLSAGLRRALEEERSRNVPLQEPLRSQTAEISRLSATLQDARTLLGEIAGILDRAPDRACQDGEADQERGEWSELAELVEGPDETTEPVQEVHTILRPIVEAVQAVLGTADDPAKRPLAPAAEPAPVRQSVQQIALQWRRFQQERANLVRRERQLQAENVRLSASLAALIGEPETQGEGQRPLPTGDQRARKAEAVSKRGQGEKGPQPIVADMKGDSPTPAGPPTSPQKVSKRRSPFTGMAVECTLEGSGRETTHILRGKISRINTMGLMGAFAERIPEGRRVVIRFVREDEKFAFLGRVVRVRQSAVAPGVPVVYNHLIRFDSPMPGFPRQFTTLLT